MKSKTLNADFWNNKYINNEDRWGTGVVSPAFINWEKNLKEKFKILIPGCGKSAEVKYFSDNKHNVYALDISKVAINYIRKETTETSTINLLHRDFFTLDKKYHNFFDCIVEYTFYCAFDPVHRAAYVKKCYQLLKKKGRLVGIFLPLYIQNDNSNPPFEVNIENDIKSLFKNYFTVLNIDFKLNSIPQRKGNEVFVEFLKK